MMLAAFDVHDQRSNAFLVFAQDAVVAAALANAHLAALGGFPTSAMTAIERRPSVKGRAREHLIAAITGGASGIGHLQPCGSWMVLPPGGRPAICVRPRPTEMHLYTDDDDRQVVLFAGDGERADALYDAIQFDYSVLPAGWLGSEVDAWQICGLVRHQHQAEARGVEGLGIYTPDGWQLLPLDYDAVGVSPP